jgi:hypothetical protein
MKIDLDQWYIGLQIAWLVVAVLIGALSSTRRQFPKYALVGGILLTLALHGAEGGPGMFLGPVIYTCMCLALEWVGRGLRMLFMLGAAIARGKKRG